MLLLFLGFRLKFLAELIAVRRLKPWKLDLSGSRGMVSLAYTASSSSSSMNRQENVRLLSVMLNAIWDRRRMLGVSLPPTYEEYFIIHRPINKIFRISVAKQRHTPFSFHFNFFVSSFTQDNAHVIVYNLLYILRILKNVIRLCAPINRLLAPPPCLSQHFCRLRRVPINDTAKKLRHSLVKRLFKHIEII